MKKVNILNKDNLNFKNYSIEDPILKALDELNYKHPSKVQQEVIPLALMKNDIVVKAETGSGKTAAFSIPLCSLIPTEVKNPKALVLTPTRELAIQVKEDINNIGRYKKIRSAAIFGKQPFNTQINELKQRVHIVVGTPGRTLDHMEKGTLVTDDISFLILDEADEMLNMGFLEQVEEIISHLPKKRVNMLFSATMPDKIKEVYRKHMNDPKLVEIIPEISKKEKIDQGYITVKEQDKFSLLEKVLIAENPDSAILFCSTQDKVHEVFIKLKNKTYPVKELHGGMLQKDRLNAMSEFKAGGYRFLVATDIAARGIDVEKISLVINYDIPLEKEKYVHRIGRTGRAGNSGRAVTFVTPYEDKFLKELQEYIKYEIPKLSPPSKEDFIPKKEAFKLKNESFKNAVLKNKKEVKAGIVKIYLNGGKKKKIRPGDIVGALCKIPDVTVEDIGIIDVQENVSYVDVLNGKGHKVLKALQTSKIKGKILKAEIAKS